MVNTVPADAFELGRILWVETGTRVSIESVIPMGETVIPFVWIYDSGPSVEDRVREHPFVGEFKKIESKEDQHLYAIDWRVEKDHFITSLLATEAQVLGAVGGPDRWQFELRFPSHDALTEFSDRCARADISLTVDRIFNPTNPDAGPFYGLTAPQREALVKAVQSGYYCLPRQSVTKEIAEELGISDQVVTDRLRRAITNLV